MKKITLIIGVIIVALVGFAYGAYVNRQGNALGGFDPTQFQTVTNSGATNSSSTVSITSTSVYAASGSFNYRRITNISTATRIWCSLGATAITGHGFPINPMSSTTMDYWETPSGNGARWNGSVNCISDGVTTTIGLTSY